MAADAEAALVDAQMAAAALADAEAAYADARRVEAALLANAPGDDQSEAEHGAVERRLPTTATR